MGATMFFTGDICRDYSQQPGSRAMPLTRLLCCQSQLFTLFLGHTIKSFDLSLWTLKFTSREITSRSVVTPHSVLKPLCIPLRSLTYPSKDMNLCRQLNLLTFLTHLAPPPLQPNTTRKRKWQGHGGERSSQAMLFKCRRTRLMESAAVEAACFY